MKFERVDINNYIDKIFNAITSREDIAIYGIPPKTMVIRGKAEIDEQYCEKNKITVYNSYNEGGCIVSEKGDIIVALMRNGGWDDGNKFETWIVDYLKKIGLNVSSAGNDILIDEVYKVASFSSINLGNGFIYTGIMITLNANIEHIKHICKKPMQKIPRGLSKYGLTSGKMENDFIEFLKSI